jgi:L-fucose isomerase-like protein
MLKDNQKGANVGRRDFLRTTTIASIAAALPETNLLGQDAESPAKPIRQDMRNRLLFMSESPLRHERLIESIKSIGEVRFAVSSIQVDYRRPQEIANFIRDSDADILLMYLPRMSPSLGNIATATGKVDTPIVLLPSDPALMMFEADLAAAFRVNGTNAVLANSQEHALELLVAAASPGILEGRKALIFGRPFDSTSIPAHNLNEDNIYRRTGVKLRYRPLEELNQLLESVDEASARKEMGRWKSEAYKILEASDSAIFDASRLYVLLRSLVDKESLSAVSIDCGDYTRGAEAKLPYPCLAFTRLRDEGVVAACEADVCAMLSSMLLQEISGNPSYFCNVSSVDIGKSSTVLRHCAAPLQLMGYHAPKLQYNLRDYHGYGRGATPEIEFPTGIEVTMGSFSKDLKSFLIWPGRVVPRVKDTDRPMHPKSEVPKLKDLRLYCSNQAEVKIKEADRFLRSIGGCHHIVVAGRFAVPVRDAVLKMNVDIVGPSDLTAPEA